jgi:hypothetical protein
MGLLPRKRGEDSEISVMMQRALSVEAMGVDRTSVGMDMEKDAPSANASEVRNRGRSARHMSEDRGRCEK